MSWKAQKWPMETTLVKIHNIQFQKLVKIQSMSDLRKVGNHCYNKSKISGMSCRTKNNFMLQTLELFHDQTGPPFSLFFWREKLACPQQELQLICHGCCTAMTLMTHKHQKLVLLERYFRRSSIVYFDQRLGVANR